MLKHKHKALDRQLAKIYGHAADLYAAVEEELAAGNPVHIPDTHHEHVSDIVGTLLVNSPSLAGDHALLLELGQATEARQRVKDALAVLYNIDAALFMGAPSPRLLARMALPEQYTREEWVRVVSTSDYADTDERRRRALPLRRAALVRGEAPLTETAVQHLPGRDEARAQESRTGGGVRGTFDQSAPRPRRSNVK